MMKHIEAFIEAKGLVEEAPAEAVRLGARALLELSFLQGLKPVKAKKGLPIYRHFIPTETYLFGVRVKPHLSPALASSEPIERALAAETPASISLLDGMFTDVSFSFDVVRDVVAVQLNNGRPYPCGESSTTERGMNAIRNSWQNMHLPTIAYVEQAALKLTHQS